MAEWKDGKAYSQGIEASGIQKVTPNAKREGCF
jgi:hypothetical protein